MVEAAPLTPGLAATALAAEENLPLFPQNPLLQLPLFQTPSHNLSTPSHSSTIPSHALLTEDTKTRGIPLREGEASRN